MEQKQFRDQANPTLKDQSQKPKRDHLGSKLVINNSCEINCVLLDKKQQDTLKTLVERNYKIDFDNSLDRDLFQKKRILIYKKDIKFRKYKERVVHLLEDDQGRIAFCTKKQLFPILLREQQDYKADQVIENDYFSFLVQLLKGKKFITYGSRYSRPIAAALRTMKQKVEQKGKSSQKEMGETLTEIQKKLPTFSKIQRDDKKVMILSQDINSVYREQIGSVFWGDFQTESSEDQTDSDLTEEDVIFQDPDYSLMGFQGKLQREDSIGSLEGNKFQPQQVREKQGEELKQGDLDQQENLHKSENQRNLKKQEIIQKFGLKESEIENELDLSEMGTFSLVQEIHKSVQEELNLKVSRMTHIFIKDGDFVRKQFKNQLQVDGFHKIEIMQFSNQMRALVKRLRNSFRDDQDDDLEYRRTVIKTVKRLVVARDKPYEDCMKDYIEMLIIGYKQDFDEFYRQVNNI